MANTHAVDLDNRPPLSFYLSVGLVAGSIIALQIGIMRVFSVGSWAHFGSLVVSLAMFGFGLTSAVMCVGKGWFERHWEGAVKLALLLFGPLMVVCNLVAQQVPFNAIFLISDPMQKWRLFANFVLYFLPFLAGALYLGVVFLKAQKTFNRVYFADLVGSGLCGLSVLLAMYAFKPDDIVMAPLLLWLAGGLLWFVALGDRRGMLAIVAVAILSAAVHYAAPGVLGIPKLAVSDYKGVSYARKFPDNQRTYERASPFGYMEVYSSSYLHFAPGLSDNAAFNLKKMPSNAYLGLYLDSEGPSGVIKDLSPDETAYFRFLPMYYPYVLKQDPDTFVVQFGGGISTAVALKSGSKHVTVAEGNPAILTAFREDKGLRDFTGDILNNPKVSVIDYDGRLYVAHTKNRYDIIDLSLADSAGLSSPGGFSIVEKYSYTREAMAAYMRVLKPGGILSVTLWNKEEPPKSVLKLYATMAAAARDVNGPDIARDFYVVSSYLSTATVLYKRGGFTPAEIEKLWADGVAMMKDAGAEIVDPDLDQVNLLGAELVEHAGLELDHLRLVDLVDDAARRSHDHHRGAPGRVVFARVRHAGVGQLDGGVEVDLLEVCAPGVLGRHRHLGERGRWRDGGVFAIHIPKAPFRCPPGPYERICQVADYFKRAKPKSKIIVLDSNPDVVSKAGLFKAAWANLYKGMIDYRPNSELADVDVAAHVDFGVHPRLRPVVVQRRAVADRQVAGDVERAPVFDDAAAGHDEVAVGAHHRVHDLVGACRRRDAAAPGHCAVRRERLRRSEPCSELRQPAG